MRRWNGWGEELTDYALHGEPLLEKWVGRGTPPRDAAFGDVIRTVPPSRLPEHPLLKREAEIRLLHARGQSFPDWVALRSGQITTFPDAVAFPESAAQVRELLQFARSVGAKVIPYGGGTSVVGHINPEASAEPVLTISMARLTRLSRFDQHSQVATFGAGATGPDVEAQLRAHGFTLGHFPQSFELSTLGGWIAARSSGQQSIYYGRVERFFAGGEVETPSGSLHLPVFPASAAGTDLREMILGSEGRLGIITEASVRVTPLPEYESFQGIFFPSFEAGMEAARSMVQGGLPISMLRLSNATETMTNLALAGRERLVGMIERLLRSFQIGPNKALMVVGYTGSKALCRTVRAEVMKTVRDRRGTDLGIGQILGSQWRKSRFRTPYLRNTLWEKGYAVDTFETALTWDKIPAYIQSVEAIIRTGLSDKGERVHVFTHLSHLYPHGASAYTTYLFRIPADPAETLLRWQHLKAAASAQIVAFGGTISHQHGVGVDHRPYLKAEKDALGLRAMTALFKSFDPDGMMNPGKLIET